MIGQCIVCYEHYISATCMLACKHNLCSVCHSKLVNKTICPLCRQPLVVYKTNIMFIAVICFVFFIYVIVF